MNLPMLLKSYQSRHGTFGIVPADSTLIGDAVEIGVGRTREFADEMVKRWNQHSTLVAVAQAAKEYMELENKLCANRPVKDEYGTTYSATRISGLAGELNIALATLTQIQKGE